MDHRVSPSRTVHTGPTGTDGGAVGVGVGRVCCRASSVYGRSIRRDDMQMVLERNGYPEECYFTFSQSPIRHLDGSIAGIFTVAAETTGHVLHRRRLGVIQELGTLSATHAGSPAETCQAALDVLAAARASLPFAAVLLREQADGPIATVARYGVADDSVLSTLTPSGLTYGGPTVPSPEEPVVST